MNGIYQGTGPLLQNSCNVRSGDGAWRRRGNDGFDYVPIGEYLYDTAVADGFGYIHAMSHDQHKHEVSSRRGVRQLITVTGRSRQVDELHFYAEHLEGRGPIATSVTAEDSRDGQWFTFPLEATLADGVSYELEFSAQGDGRYNAWVFRSGEDYGYSSQSEFADGYAQYSETVGVWENWKIWGNSTTQGDLMFYFVSSRDGAGTAVEDTSWGQAKQPSP